MRAISLQGKAYTAPVVAAVGLSAIGAGLLSNKVMADTTLVTDTINVTVQQSCTFNSVEDKTYTGSAANGVEVDDFNDSGRHEFNLFCNNNSGFTVSATPYDLAATGIVPKISYTDSYAASGTNSLWTAGITSEAENVTVTPVVPVGGGTIISSNTHTPTGGVSFTATYRAYVGSATPAGTYTGTIVYTLAPTGSTNSGSNAQQNANQNNGGSGSNPTNTSNEPEQGEPEQGEPEQGEPEQGGNEQSGSEQSGTEQNNPAPSNSPSNTNNQLNAAPLMMTPNNTYSTYNTYNTTNYQGGGSTVPTVGASTPALSSDDDDDEIESNSGTSSTTDSSYESPLGVTTTANSSSNKNSGGIDPMPIIATGALAVTGLAAVALIRNGSKEEEKEQ